MKPSEEPRGDALAENLPGSFRFYTTFGRTALWAALRAAGVENREVLLPAFTCRTTVVDAVLQAGGLPVFVDIQLPHLQMDLSQLRRKITRKTKAVISHHYYGFPTPFLEEVQGLCGRRGLVHIEDCSHSLGAARKGKPTGSWGDMAVYSFSKSMVGPGGGCVTAKTSRLIQKVGEFSKEKGFVDEVYKNYHVFEHGWELRKDINETGEGLAPLFWAARAVLYIHRKITGYPPERVKGKFYEMKSPDPVDPPSPDFCLKMTRLQHSSIEKKLMNWKSQVKIKETLFKRLVHIVSPAIPLAGDRPNFSIFPFKVKDKGKLLSRAAGENIRLRETWPAFQDYLRRQKTRNVMRMAEGCLLVNLEQYSPPEKAEKLERFFADNRNQII